MLGHFADEVDVEQAVFIAGAGHFDGVGELETPLERALGDAAMQEDAVICGFGRIGGGAGDERAGWWINSSDDRAGGGRGGGGLR